MCLRLPIALTLSLLVVVDDKSGYVWAFGLRKKSETMMIMQSLIKKIEKRLRKRVEFIDADIENDGELLGVSALRCDNAGENVLGAMRRWCDERGTGMKPPCRTTTTRLARLGGVVWIRKGGAALR